MYWHGVYDGGFKFDGHMKNVMKIDDTGLSKTIQDRKAISYSYESMHNMDFTRFKLD